MTIVTPPATDPPATDMPATAVPPAAPAPGHAIADALPAVLQGDDFVRRFTGGLDEVLAPVFTVLDCFESYLDPELAPEDLLEWLAGWVALPLDDRWSVRQQRALVASAVEMHRRRGTPGGLAAQLELLTGGQVDVADNGGCTWSEEPRGALPGRYDAEVRVTVRVPASAPVDERRLRTVVAAAVPAHLPVTLTVETVPDPPAAPATGRAQVPTD